jgi:hypothetical protein
MRLRGLTLTALAGLLYLGGPSGPVDTALTVPCVVLAVAGLAVTAVDVIWDRKTRTA